MKKIIYLFCLICTITLAKGQYYRPDRGFLPGINAGYFYPTGDMGKILKNGIGGNVSAKYLINKMIGIGFEAGYYAPPVTLWELAMPEVVMVRNTPPS